LYLPFTVCIDKILFFSTLHQFSPMNRRTFLAAAAGASTTAASLIPSAVQAQPKPDSTTKSNAKSHAKSSAKKSRNQPELLKPRALEAGMKIGLAFPAGWTKMEDVEKGKAYLESQGYTVVIGENAGKAHGYLSAPDKDRAAELMKLVERKDVDAIICARGGYGVMRMLDYLDFASIRANAKIICGYSDITALVNSIYQRSGVVALHGPGALAAWDEYTQTNFIAVATAASVQARRAAKTQFVTPAPLSIAPAVAPAVSSITSTTASTTVSAMATVTPSNAVSAVSPIRTITSGTATGRLVGGNLTLISFLVGTPYDIDTTGRILFFEDVTEEPYRIDRMLTQLALAGKLQRCAGIAIGNFTRCEASDPEHSFSIADLLKEKLGALGIPCVAGLQFGHITSKLTFPVGINVALNADAGTLTFLEEAVA
jgi:muramoyltetrapeptide carboxypeptidase